MAVDMTRTNLIRARELLDKERLTTKQYKVMDALWQCMFSMYQEIQLGPAGPFGSNNRPSPEDMMNMAGMLKANMEAKKHSEEEKGDERPRPGQYL